MPTPPDVEQLARARGYQVETGVEPWGLHRATIAWIRFGQGGKLAGWGSIVLWGGDVEKRALKFCEMMVGNLPIQGSRE